MTDPMKLERLPAEDSDLKKFLELKEEEIAAWRQDSFLSWLPRRGLEILGACFDMTAERLSPGDCRDTAGRAGYLLSGRLSGKRGTVGPGTLLGVRRGTGETRVGASERLTAREESLVLWWHIGVVDTVCYNACWFHARLIREMDERTEAEEH